MKKPLFNLGQICATPPALKAMALSGVTPVELLQRHVSGDWGDLDHEDAAANDEAVHFGNLRVFSSYKITPDVKIWVITEADRSVTTLLLPDDY